MPARPLRGARARWRPVARLAAVVVAAAAATAAAQDLDGDAIPDAIEGEGWYVAAGGSRTRADVWVECDFMAGTVRKRGLIVRRTEAMFERSPFAGGITLHVAFDDRLPFEERWGDLFTAEGYAEFYGRVLDAHASLFDGRPFSGDNAAVMRDYVHYCLYINSMDSEGGVSAISLDSTTPFGGIPGDVFVAALGQYRGEFPGPVLRRVETGVLLHELGHNLGLTHGGARPLRHGNLKPNYLSVMSYHYISGFLRLADPTTPEFFPYWDYSRFRTNPLNERRLREADGLSAPPEDVVAQTEQGEDLLGITLCPEPGRALAFFWNRSIDFDCDRVLDCAPVKVDTNGDGRRSRLGRGQDNWEHLVFDGGAIGGFGAAQASTFLEPEDELDLPTLRWLLEVVPGARVDRGERPETP